MLKENGNYCLSVRELVFKVMAKNVVLLGDSIGRGVVLVGERYTLLREGVAEMCAEKLGLNLQNFSKMGSTVEKGQQILSQREAEVASADITVLEFGGNDSDFYWQEIAECPRESHEPRTPIARFVEVYRSMIQRVRELGSHPVMISLPLMDGERFIDFQTRGMTAPERQNVYDWLGHVERVRNYHDMYNIELFRLAAEERVPLVDITTPFLLSRDYQANLCADGIHPNAAGHRMMAEWIASRLKDRAAR